MTIWISKLLGPVILSVAPRVGATMVDRPKMTRLTGAFWALVGAFLTLKGYT